MKRKKPAGFRSRAFCKIRHVRNGNRCGHLGIVSRNLGRLAAGLRSVRKASLGESVARNKFLVVGQACSLACGHQRSKAGINKCLEWRLVKEFIYDMSLHALGIRSQASTTAPQMLIFY